MRVIALVIILIPLFMSCKQGPTEISQWRGPDRDGFYPDKNLLKVWPEEGPELLWSFEGLGKGYTSVAVTKDKIYTSGVLDSLSYIFALNHSGELLWKKDYGKPWTNNFPGTRSTPLIYDGAGYLLSGLGKLVCYDLNNGETIWSVDLYKDYLAREVRFGMTENLLIDEGKLFVTPGGVKHNVLALNPKNGDLIWSSRANGEKSAYCSPQLIEITGKKYLLTCTAQSAICLDPENGEMLWSHDLQYPHGIHGNTPVYHDGYVFAMNGWEHGSVMMKIKEDGKGVDEVWRSNLFDLEHGDVLRIGDNIYGTDYTTKHFSCVDWKTGVVKDSIKEFSPGSVIAADGMIYCYTYAGEMALIKPTQNSFEIVSSFKVPGKKRDHLAHPVIYDGKLYLRYDKSIWVYSISAKEQV